MVYQQCLFIFVGMVTVQAMMMDLKFEDCSSKVGCAFISSCTSLDDCPAMGIYYYNATSKMFNFQLRFTTKWAAFSQNEETATDKMSGMRGFYCTADGGTATSGFLEGEGQTTPTWIDEGDVTEVNGISMKTENGVNYCSFQRPSAITSENGLKALYPLDKTNLINIVAYGDTLADGKPTKHTAYYIGKAAIANWMLYSMGEAPVASTMAPAASSTMATDASSTMASDASTTMLPDDGKDGKKGEDGEDSAAMLTQGSLLLVTITAMVLKMLL